MTGEWRVGFEHPSVNAFCLERNPGWTPIVADCPPFAFGAVIALTDTREIAEEIVGMRRRLEAAEALSKEASYAALLLEEILEDEETKVAGLWQGERIPRCVRILRKCLAAYREASK